MDDLLDRTDAVGLADAIRRKEVSEAEVLEATMARIDERNPEMNAITTLVEPEPAADGRLRGVPFAVKDLHFAMRGTVATHGSRYFADAPRRRPRRGGGAPLSRRRPGAGGPNQLARARSVHHY